MDWPASTGPATIRFEHLRDAVIAANEDPLVQVPRIRLGHTSPINGDAPQHDPFAALGDAAPSFGVFRNLRLINDGAVLVGDADEIPAWLAEMAPSAYPNRSAEAVWQVVSPQADVQTSGDRRYEMVLTGVALLGVEIPAVGDLPDLQELIVNGPSALKALSAAAGDGEGTSLSVSTTVVRERFNFGWAMDPENEAEQNTYWWWARDVRVDPMEIIADDDEGGLWSVPYSTDGEDEVTFGEPQRVRETFVPVAAAQVATFARPSKPSRPPATAAASNPAATARPDEGESPMTDQVREFLVGRGIDPDTATDVQINAATILLGEQPPAEKADEPEAPETPEAGADDTATTDTVVSTDDAQTDPAKVPVAASRQIPEGAVVIDADELARLRAGAEAGTRLAAEQRTKERDTLLAKARDEGRFPPSRLAHYTRLYDSDPEGTKVLLTADEKDGGLAKGTVPLEAKAHTPDPEGEDADGLTAGDRALLAASRDRMGFKTAEVA